MTPAACKAERDRLVGELRRERECQGLERKDLVDMGGPTEGCLKTMERGRWGPTLATFIYYADALGYVLGLVRKHEDD